jgi:hypothetical protein
MGAGRRLRTALLGALLAVALGNPAAWSGSLVDIRVGRHREFTRVVFELDADADYTVRAGAAELARNEVVVELGAESVPRAIASQSPLVESVVVEPVESGSLARIRLRAPPLRVEDMVVPDPPRIVLDLRTAAEPAAPPSAAQVPAPAEARKLAEPPPAPPREEQPAAPPTEARIEGEPAPAPVERKPALAVPPSEAQVEAKPAPVPVERKPVLAARTSEARVEAKPAPAPLEKEPVPAAPPGEERIEAEPAPPPVERKPEPIARKAPPTPQAAAQEKPGARLREPPRPPQPVAPPAPLPRPPRPAPEGGLFDNPAVLLGAVAVAIVILFLVWRQLRRGSRQEALPSWPPEESIEEPVVEAQPEAPEPPLEASAQEGAVEARQPEAEEPSPEVESAGEEEKTPMDREFESGTTPAPPPMDLVEEATLPARRGLEGRTGELERRVANLEKRLEELLDTRERLERQVAAQTEELRVQRAAIARTQRVLRNHLRPGEPRPESGPKH